MLLDAAVAMALLPQRLPVLRAAALPAGQDEDVGGLHLLLIQELPSKHWSRSAGIHIVLMRSTISLANST
jgi:hypothetical protein